MKQLGRISDQIAATASLFARASDNGRAKAKHCREKGYKFHSQVHDWQLFRGDQQFGKPKQMLGFDVLEENRRLRDKFWRDLDANKSARLWVWKLVGGYQNPPSQNEAENKAVPFKHNMLNRGPGYRRK